MTGLRAKCIDVKTAAAAVREALPGRHEEALRKLDAALDALYTETHSAPRKLAFRQ